MNRVLSFAKYQLADYRKAVLIFYSVIAALAVIMIATSRQSSGQSSLSGASIVFVFALGLNCFKTSFLFSQANNISRKTFYWATLVSLVALSVIMGLVDFALDSYMNRLPIYQGFFEQIYFGKIYFQQIYVEASLAKILWSMAVLTFAGSLGWLITMLYYRSSTLLKVVISISPVVFLTLITFFDLLTAGRLGNSLLVFLAKSLGLGLTSTPYPAILSFTLGSAVLWTLNYFLMYKVPARAQ